MLLHSFQPTSMHGDGETSTVVTGKKGTPEAKRGGDKGGAEGGSGAGGEEAPSEEAKSTPYSELEKSGNVSFSCCHRNAPHICESTA